MDTIDALQHEKEHLADVVSRDVIQHGSVREANTSVNNSSRRCIKKMHEHYGECWIGKINKHKEDEDKPAIYKHDPLVLVCNFEADFVLPQFDQTLVDLLTERWNAPYTNANDDYVRILKINERIEKVQGVHLIWS